MSLNTTNQKRDFVVGCWQQAVSTPHHITPRGTRAACTIALLPQATYHLTDYPPDQRVVVMELSQVSSSTPARENKESGAAHVETETMSTESWSSQMHSSNPLQANPLSMQRIPNTSSLQLAGSVSAMMGTSHDREASPIQSRSELAELQPANKALTGLEALQALLEIDLSSQFDPATAVRGSLRTQTTYHM